MIASNTNTSFVAIPNRESNRQSNFPSWILFKIENVILNRYHNCHTNRCTLCFIFASMALFFALYYKAINSLHSSRCNTHVLLYRYLLQCIYTVIQIFIFMFVFMFIFTFCVIYTFVYTGGGRAERFWNFRRRWWRRRWRWRWRWRWQWWWGRLDVLQGWVSLLQSRTLLMNELRTLMRRRTIRCVAVCFSRLDVLQSVSVCCSLFQSFAVCFSLLQSVLVCFSLLQFVLVCCGLLQRTIRFVAVYNLVDDEKWGLRLHI